MTIYLGSRYEYATIDFFATKSGGDENPTVFYSVSNLGKVTYWTHTYKTGERLDQISNKYYNKPELWWLIAEYNPEVKDFMNIPANTKLRIPRV